MEPTCGHSLKKQALMLGQECRYEEVHSLQVCALALQLFDTLAALHALGVQERCVLEAAAILHDIGWIKGQKKHHKTALDIIITSKTLVIPFAQRVIIGLVARYHRKSLPKESHAYYMDLDEKARKTVEILAGFLRLADGLDRSHRASVAQIRCSVSGEAIMLQLTGKKIAPEDIATGYEKSDLMERVFARKVEISVADGVQRG